jgi:hypothetical protein
MPLFSNPQSPSPGVWEPEAAEGRLAWGQNCLEFVATGTAVRHLTGQGAHRAPDGRAFTSDLSAQDFWAWTTSRTSAGARYG